MPEQRHYRGAPHIGPNWELGAKREIGCLVAAPSGVSCASVAGFQAAPRIPQGLDGSRAHLVMQTHHETHPGGGTMSKVWPPHVPSQPLQVSDRARCAAGGTHLQTRGPVELGSWGTT